MEATDATSRPTLVVAHGHGSDAATAAALAGGIDPDGRADHVTPEGPVPVDGAHRAWFEGGSAESIRHGAEVLRAALAASEAGAPRVVVGWSQGGAAALAALATPGAPTVDALVLLGAFLADAPGLDYDLSLLAGTQVLIQHGEHDDVVPSFFAEDLATTLRAVGVTVELQLVPLGHELDRAAVAAVATWVGERWS